jgi:hypothetical protein
MEKGVSRGRVLPSTRIRSPVNRHCQSSNSTKLICNNISKIFYKILKAQKLVIMALSGDLSPGMMSGTSFRS